MNANELVVNERIWNRLDETFRDRLLKDLPDANGVDRSSDWSDLPYWLQRYLVHFVTVQYGTV